MNPELPAARVAYQHAVDEIQGELRRLETYAEGSPAARPWRRFVSSYPDTSVAFQLQNHLDTLAAALPAEYQMHLHGLVHLVSAALAQAARVAELSRKRRRRRLKKQS